MKITKMWCGCNNPNIDLDGDFETCLHCECTRRVVGFQE